VKGIQTPMPIGSRLTSWSPDELASVLGTPVPKYPEAERVRLSLLKTLSRMAIELTGWLERYGVCEEETR
jgi:hypothetical protein